MEVPDKLFLLVGEEGNQTSSQASLVFPSLWPFVQTLFCCYLRLYFWQWVMACLVSLIYVLLFAK